MAESIFQVSDLANKRTQLIDAARTGRAKVRDKDGTSLVMLQETELTALEELAAWSQAHLRLEELLRKGVMPAVGDLGALAWLRVFDCEEVREFLGELHVALVASYADGTSTVLQECVEAWKTTARQLEDPLRRSVLRGPLAEDSLVDADRPDER